MTTPPSCFSAAARPRAARSIDEALRRTRKAIHRVSAPLQTSAGWFSSAYEFDVAYSSQRLPCRGVANCNVRQSYGAALLVLTMPQCPQCVNHDATRCCRCGLVDQIFVRFGQRRLAPILLSEISAVAGHRRFGGLGRCGCSRGGGLRGSQTHCEREEKVQ